MRRIDKYRGWMIEYERGGSGECAERPDGWYWSLGTDDDDPVWRPYVGPCETLGAARRAAQRDIDRAAQLDMAERLYAAGYDAACGYAD
jgi:hypothetical protein